MSVVISACGLSATGDSSTAPDSSPRVLTAAGAKHLLLELPYHYRWRQVELPKGASDALAGTATGNHHTIVHFSISFGTGTEAVPVPQAGVLTPDYYGGLGFVFNNDLEVPGKNESVHTGKQFHTAAQWDEAINMAFEMEEKLCKAVSGKPCPV
jgi:hypothetical protein